MSGLPLEGMGAIYTQIVLATALNLQFDRKGKVSLPLPGRVTTERRPQVVGGNADPRPQASEGGAFIEYQAKRHMRGRFGC